MVGALIFLQKLRISPDAAFSVNDWTAFVIFITVIGGIGRIEGPIVGTIVFFVLRQTLSDLGSVYLLMLGAVAIADQRQRDVPARMRLAVQRAFDGLYRKRGVFFHQRFGAGVIARFNGIQNRLVFLEGALRAAASTSFRAMRQLRPKELSP